MVERRAVTDERREGFECRSVSLRKVASALFLQRAVFSMFMPRRLCFLQEVIAANITARGPFRPLVRLRHVAVGGFVELLVVLFTLF